MAPNALGSPDIPSLTLSAMGSGTATATPTGPAYPAGTVVTLAATPAPGRFFVGWFMRDGEGWWQLGSDNPLELVMATDYTLVACFVTDRWASCDFPHGGGARVAGQLAHGLAGGIGIVRRDDWLGEARC